MQSLGFKWLQSWDRFDFDKLFEFKNIISAQFHITTLFVLIVQRSAVEFDCKKTFDSAKSKSFHRSKSSPECSESHLTVC